MHQFNDDMVPSCRNFAHAQEIGLQVAGISYVIEHLFCVFVLARKSLTSCPGRHKVHDDEDARQEGEVDAHVEDGEQVLVELHPAEDEEQEEDGQAVQDRLDDPGPEGRVDVDQVSPLSVLYHILERLMRQIRLEKF